MIANFISILSYDFKPAKFILCFAPVHVFLLDKMGEPRLANRVAERLELSFGAFGDQLHPPVRQIADRSQHFVAVGH